MATQASADLTAPKPRILRIGIIQGGRIVEERLVRKRENISVGQSAKNMFVVPSDALPRTWMLFEATSKGYVAHFGEGMDARIAVGQEIISLAQMKQGGKIQKTGQSWDMVLDERARGKITVGDLTILFQFVTPPPPQPRPQLPASVRGSFTANLDWFFTSMTVGSFVIHLCLIIYLRSVDWPKKPDIEEIPDRFVQMVVKKKVEPPPEEKKPDEKKADEKKPDDVAKKQPKKDDAPAPVKKELTEAEKQKIAEDKAKADAERRAKIAEQVQNTGILKLLGARADGEGAIADVLGKGDVDRDQEKAFEGVGGLTVATGDDGLRGVKSGTGGNGKVASISGLRGGGSIEGGSTGVGAGEKSVKAVVSSAAPSVDGELDPNVVAKEVKRRIGAVKVCYERALKRNPALSGKIVVRWTITPEGTVTGLDVENDTLGDPEVGQCIKKNISGWRFPRPSGGSVEVSFPFVFQASS
jgi:hypothetical protein